MALTYIELGPDGAGGGGGSGDVVGPASSVDSNIAAFDGATGKLLKDSGILSTDVFNPNGTNLYGDTPVTTSEQKDINGDMQLQQYVDITNTTTGILNNNGNSLELATVDDWTFGAGYKQAYFYMASDGGWPFPYAQVSSVEDGGQGTSLTVSSDPSKPLSMESNSVEVLRILSNGGFVVSRSATAVSANTNKEFILGVTDTSVSRTITLASADVLDGRVIIIKDESGAAGTNNITIDTQGAELIDGAASILISANYGCARLYSNGTNWFSI